MLLLFYALTHQPLQISLVIMADAEKPKTVKVTYLGNDPRPNGMLGGSVPVNGNTYTIPTKIWEKKNQEDWKESNASTKKPAKKKTVSKKKEM